MYVEITGRENGDSRFDIVAPVTAGTSDGLRVGKGGIFFTTDGREWDAEIKEIMVNPVSIGESVRAPFEKIADFIRAQIGKFSKSQEDKVAASLGSGTPTSATRDLLLAGSVAIAALGSAFAYMTKAFAQVKVNHILGAFVVIAFFLLLPSIVIGLLRIRKRNLSTILEASGWAINVRMRLTRDLGCLFTHVPQLPKGAQKEKKDTVGKFLRDIGIYPFLSICVLIILLIFLALVTVYQLKSFGILTFG